LDRLDGFSIIYIASHQPPQLSDADCQKLKSFAENGGLLFTHADGDSPEFNKFVADLCKRIFPKLSLKLCPRP